ncbi:MFS transporter [Candidatus Poriferisocius sp.]|uniref:MFS transporter n=1 Tax=Candidatus Poriferisocius sp. TaxID=3101276 RepID=UPI003B0140D9
MAFEEPSLEEPSTVASTRVGRIFGSPQYFRLWIAQMLSSGGDWLALFAILITADRVGGGTPEASVAYVMIARFLPGLVFGSAAGVLVDRWDRKRTMVVCDLGRAATLLWLPFVDFIWQLVVASLILEGFALLWAPAKEASVPNLVPREKLTGVNSLSLVAAYGTFPLAAGVSIGLAGLASIIGRVEAVDFMRIDPESMAFYIDAATFAASAFIISRLALPRSPQAGGANATGSGDSTRVWAPAQFLRDLKDGWSYMFLNPTVRTVNVALAVGLVGGGMIVPLGPVFAEDVLSVDGGDGFRVFMVALGIGVALAIAGLTVRQRHLNKERVFLFAVFGAGACLFVATCMWTLYGSALLVGGLGVCAGTVYVLGITLLQESATEELRVRVFAGLFTLVRSSVMLALLLGPALALFLNGLSDKFFDKDVNILGFEVIIPGVRLTLWLAALIMLAAWFLTLASVGKEQSSDGAR